MKIKAEKSVKKGKKKIKLKKEKELSDVTNEELAKAILKIAEKVGVKIDFNDK